MTSPVGKPERFFNDNLAADTLPPGKFIAQLESTVIGDEN